MTRAQIVEEALRWERTRAVWGQSRRGVACDCKGFIFGIARELGLPEARVPEVQARGYRRASPAQLLRGLEAALIRTTVRRPADVLAMPLPGRTEPQHLGILISDREMMHCYGGHVGHVVRVPIGRSRPIHSVWTWPSLEGG